MAASWALENVVVVGGGGDMVLSSFFQNQYVYRGRFLVLCGHRLKVWLHTRCDIDLALI